MSQRGYVPKPGDLAAWLEFTTPRSPKLPLPAAQATSGGISGQDGPLPTICRLCGTPLLPELGHYATAFRLTLDDDGSLVSCEPDGMMALCPTCRAAAALASLEVR